MEHFKADLHVHSNYSDNPLSLDEIFCLARERGVTHISVTDHDGADGCEKAMQVAGKYDILCVKGIEISAFDFAGDRKVHVLGYGFRNDELLNEFCAPVRKRRHDNSLAQIEIFKKLGYKLMTEDVLPYAQRHKTVRSDVIYKQHILHCLYDTNQTASLFADYNRLFKNGGPCDFDIRYIDAREAVRMIKEAGGLPVLAHPMQQGNLDIAFDLKKEGLFGVEAYHHSASVKEAELIRETAATLGLAATGGSDFHSFYMREPIEPGQFTAPSSHELSKLFLSE